MRKIYYSENDIDIINQALDTMQLDTAADDFYAYDLKFVKNNCIKKLNKRCQYWCKVLDDQNDSHLTYPYVSISFWDMKFPGNNYTDAEENGIEIQGELSISFTIPRNMDVCSSKSIKDDYTCFVDPYVIRIFKKDSLYIKSPSHELLIASAADCDELREFWQPIIDKALCEQIDWDNVYKVCSEFIDEFFLNFL